MEPPGGPRAEQQRPDLGDWDHPIHGQLGVLRTDGEKVECHACGRWYHNLANHVRPTHGLEPDEYRAIFGLRATTGLAGPAYKAKAQRQAEHNHFSEYWPAARERIRAQTSEERSARSSGRNLPLEAKLDPENQRTWQEQARQRGEQLHALYQAGVWAPPVPPGRLAALAKATDRWRELRKDPERYAAWRQHVAEAAAARRRDFVCLQCGKAFTRSATWAGERLCSDTCARAYASQRQTGRSPAQRPDVRAKIVAAKRRRQGDYDRVLDQLRTVDPATFQRLPALERAVVRRYYGLADGRPWAKRELAASVGIGVHSMERALGRGLAALLGSEGSQAVPATVTKSCPECGTTLEAASRRTYCSERCASDAARKGRRRAAATCAACGRPFLGEQGQRYCSPACVPHTARSPEAKAKISAAARRRGRPHAEELGALQDAAFDALSALDRALIRGYYGLDGDEPETLLALARRHVLGERRVRRIVERGVQHLLSPLVAVGR